METSSDIRTSPKIETSPEMETSPGKMAPKMKTSEPAYQLHLICSPISKLKTKLDLPETILGLE